MPPLTPSRTHHGVHTQIASYLLRMHAVTVTKALQMFEKARAPGIYKHYYIR